MSYVLETLNRGNVENCGFVYGNKDIKLGALPSMPIEEFVEYAAETTIQILESEDLDPKLKSKLLARTAFECGRLFQSRLDRIPNIDNDPETRAIAKIAESFGDQLAKETAPLARHYRINPFRLEDGKVIISEFYETTFEDFVCFATYVFGGGSFGHNWDFMRPPEEIKTTILELADRLMEFGKFKKPTE